MNVELPKDADGREIPLDTVVLFSRDGHDYNIVRWSFITDFETGNEFANSWRAISENGLNIKPELMYLTPPDSWEKLEEDLSKIVNHPKKVVCAYFGRERKECYGCKLENCEGSCSHACLEDIITRIRKLRGEGDA